MTPPRFWLYYVWQWLGQWNPVDLVAMTIMSLVALWLWRKSKDPTNTLDLGDAFLDSYTNKVSGSALVYLLMAALSAWYIVRDVADGGDPSNTLLAVLGVFVAKAGADRAISAWGTRRPDMAPPPETPTGDVAPVTVQQPDVQIKVNAPADITTTTHVSGKAAPKGK